MRRRTLLGFALTGLLDAADDQQTASGFRELLTVSLDAAIRLTGAPDGYYGNPAIRILLPEKLRPLASALAFLGLRAHVDEFVRSMNRAAEKAAPLARPIFVKAILHISFGDVKRLLTGGDRSITDFFEAKTSLPLTEAFLPPVIEKMDENQVHRLYRDLTARFERLPFANRLEPFDLDRYVVSRAIAGLFWVMGEQERLIRRNPAAQISALLRLVFGRR